MRIVTLLGIVAVFPVNHSAHWANAQESKETAKMPDSDKGLPDWKALWNFDDPAATEQKFREILPEAEASGDTLYLLELKTQIARALGLQKKYNEAHALLDELKPQLTDKFARAQIRYLLERGRIFNSSDFKTKALPLFKEAWEAANAAKEEALALDAAHMVGIAAEPDEALKWSEMAISLAERSKNDNVRGWLGPLYNNTGWTYAEREDYPKALELFQKGFEFRKKSGWNAPTVIAMWTVAHAKRKLGKPQEALEMLKEIEAKWREIGEEPDGYTWEEYGECLLALDKKEAAQPPFKKAWELLSKDEWLAENEPQRLDRLKKLGTP